jgi:cytoskeletal protein CcmA (bactofilin family)
LSSTGPAARNRTSGPAGNGSDGDQRSLVLGPRDRLIGQLYVEGDLRVVGTVEGALEVTGSVEIDEGGSVTGPVTARERLVVGRAGSMKGDVRVARLVVQDGATFSGNVSMGKFTAAPPKPAEPALAPEPVKAETPAMAPEPVKAQSWAIAPGPIKAPAPAKVPEPIKAPTPAKAPEPIKAAAPAKATEPIKAVTPAKAPEPIKAQAPAKPAWPIKAQTPARAPQPSKPPQTAKPSGKKPKRR